MTIGQRIAYKRKELGLSQEALGETLGVSRQAIYKWESDAALPEIDKLVALSKLFGVSVGWLLGVEEPAASEPEEKGSAPESSDELSEAQLKMVKEIVEQYLAAQPKPKPRRKWPWVLLSFAVLAGGFSVINRLDQIDQQYQRVQMTVSNVQDSVNSQINGISNRVEEILKSQNDLTADYGTELTDRDLAAGTATFFLRATPKTFMEGMGAVFSADSGNGIVVVPSVPGPGLAFTGEITVPLTDNIVLSVVFIAPDGTQQTQVLDTYTYLYSETIPWLSIHGDLWNETLTEKGTLLIPSPYNSLRYVHVMPDQSGDAVELADIQIGLFKNQELVAWGTPCDQPENYYGFEEHLFFEFSPLELPLSEGDTVCFAAVVADQYGRTFVVPDVLYTPENEDGKIRLGSANIKRPTDWIY